MKKKKKLSLEIFKIARLNNAQYIIGGTGTTNNPTITCQTHEDTCADSDNTIGKDTEQDDPTCGTGSQFPPVVTGDNNPPPPPPTFN